MTKLNAFYYPILLILSLILLMGYFLRSKNRMNKYGLLICIMMTLSIISYYLMSISTTMEESLQAYKLFILCECVISPSTVVYFLNICDLKIKKRYILLAYSFSLSLFLLSCIKNLEPIVFASINFSKSNLILIINEKMGLVHTIIYLQTIVYILIGIGIATYCYINKKRVSSKNAGVLILCAAFDFILYTIIKFGGLHLDFAFIRLITQFMFFHLTLRFYLYIFDTSVANEILDNEKIGFVCFNENKHLLYLNDVAKSWFKELNKCHIDEPIGSMEGILERLTNWFNRLDKTNKPIHEIYTKDSFSISIYAEKFEITKSKYGYRVIMRDDTDRQRYIALLNKEKSDAIIASQRVARAMESYVDPSVMNIVLNEKDNIAQSSEVVIMFADIRGFTTISETRSPEEIIDILNLTLDAMTSCVMQNKGQIDKFIGDCVMAVWNKKNIDDCCYLACKCAIDIKDAIRKLNKTLAEKYNLQLSVGIGVHYGLAVIGDVGSTFRRNYTVVGDTVNVCSRLEELADRDEVLVSYELIQDILERVECVPYNRGDRIRGRKGTIDIYILDSVGGRS